MPPAQATSCLGNTIVQWTFAGNTLLPSFGYGTLTSSGVAGPSYVSSGFADPPAVSFSGWNVPSLDTSRYVEFSISTLGRNSITLSFTSNRSDTGPSLFELQYSVNGGAFTPLSEAPRTVTTAELNYVFNFGSISEFNDVADLKVRLFAYSASSSSGSWRLDNVVFSGNCITPGNTLTPTSTATASPARSVIINEVAWMGTLASSDHEWIELYNNASVDINLSGWTLKAADGSPSVTITSGVISAGGYFLLRNGNVFSPDVTAPSFLYSGSLSDSGEALVLRDTRGDIIDTANGNGGAWPAGAPTSASNHGTMERRSFNADSDLNWYTSTGEWSKHDIAGNLIFGTPGYANSTPPPTPLPTNTPVLTPPKTIVITEIGWMGTSPSFPNDEWIELYNNTSVEINLNDWRIRSFRPGKGDEVFMDIVFDSAYCGNAPCKIGPNAYFLMERGDDEVISDINADMIYPSTSKTQMLNSGEMLLLCSPESIAAAVCKPSTPGLVNKVVDVVNLYEPPSATSANPWPAGKVSAPYGSMERHKLLANNDANWITNTGVRRNGLDRSGSPINGTPKRSNWAFTVTPTPTATPTSVSGRNAATGTPVPFAGPILVLNEVLPRPGADWNNDGKVDVYDEFIEVMNAGTVDLNLSAYKLDDYELNSSGKVISNAFTLPSKTLKPGEKAVFYGSQTGILLDDSGDTVRLLRASNNAVLDAVTYPPAKSLDSSICRYGDGYGLWLSGCFPTPGLPNSLIGGDTRLPSTVGSTVAACLLPDSTPLEFVQAECRERGLGIWNPAYWDSLPGEGNEIWLSEEDDKWAVIYR